MADIIYCEWMKWKRSKSIWIGVLSSFVVPFLVMINAVRIPDASLSLSGIYEDTIMLIMLLFGPLVMASAAVYLISREYTEKTLKTIFAVPIGRGQFMAGKFIMLFILVLLFMILSWLDIVVLSVLGSLFFEISEATLLSAAYFLVQMIKGGILLFAVITPFVYLALCAKGTIVPFIVIAVVILLNVVVDQRLAGVYPWSAAYLLLTGRIEWTGCPAPVGMLIILFVCAFSIGMSMRRFQKEDIV